MSKDLQLLEKLFVSPPQLWNVTQTAGGNVLRDIGPIDSITLPHSWKPGHSKHYLLGGSACETYIPEGEPDVVFFFYYRGIPWEAELGRNVVQVLAKPPHMLEKAELSAIAPVLREKENAADFKLMGIKTQDLKGRRVILLSGTYTEDQVDALTMLIDCDGSGRIIQEIEFQAAKEAYARHLPEAQRAITSICWK